MSNFKQPVSMPCTEEQYNRDLKDGMEKLGYELKETEYWDEDEYCFIITNWDKTPHHFGNGNEEMVEMRNRHFIPNYNASLFLAIAGMREGEDVHVGEWMMCEQTYFKGDSFVKGQLYLVDTSDWWMNERSAHFRKATLSELISHFTKQEKIMENKIWTLDELREGKVACVNDGNIEQLQAVLKYALPKGGIAEGKFKYYRKAKHYTDEWHCDNETDLPIQSVKLFHSQLPKEPEFKFGDKVKVWDDYKNDCETLYFVAKVGEMYLAVEYKHDLDNLIGFNGADIYSFKNCIPFPEPLKITRSEILSKFNCEDFVIVD